jgi:hypothetical protein
MAAFLSAPTRSARAEASNLLEDFPEIVTMYHLYSASDGLTHIEEMKVPPTKSVSDLLTYYDHKVQKFVIGYWPDGKVEDFHYAGHKNMLIYLQGTQILTTGDGKEYPLKAGMVAIAEDWTGKGHTFRCVAPTKKKACVLLQITIDDLDKELPLRDPPPKK